MQRYRAAAEDHIVELADIETRSETLLGAFSQLLNLQFAELVGQRLSRPGNVAIDFCRHFMDRQRGARGHVIDGLLPGPPHGVQTGIDDQTAGAPHLVGETSEVVIRISIKTGLEPEPFGVQTPPLAECRDVRETTKVRQRSELAIEG